MTRAQPSVALAVSGHGYGHSVRSAEVARALLQRGTRVLVRSEAPRWLFPQGVEWIESPGAPLDIGVVQHDGLEFDIDATRARWRALLREFDARADAEAELLKRAGVDVLVGDIPPLGFAAAARADIPSFGMTNFTWDWIYAAWPDFEDVIECIRQAYAQAEGLLRLPLHASCDDAFLPWRRVEDVPLIARRARRSRTEMRDELGWGTTDCVVLLSFGGFTAHGLDLARLERWREYVFVVTPPLTNTIETVGLPANVRVLNQQPADYVSLLAACDVVITKPGYGIVADCLANRVGVLFTDRGPFREYDVLAEALPRLGRARYVPRQDLLDGDLGPYLDALLALSTPWTQQAMNGANVVAERVLHRIVTIGTTV